MGSNYAPIAARVHSQPSLTIHKHIWDPALKRTLTYGEIFERGLAHGFTAEFYRQRKVHLVPNSPSEILDAVAEMMALLDGRPLNVYCPAWAYAEVRDLYARHSFYGVAGRTGAAMLASMSRAAVN